MLFLYSKKQKLTTNDGKLDSEDPGNDLRYLRVYSATLMQKVLKDSVNQINEHTKENCWVTINVMDAKHRAIGQDGGEFIIDTVLFDKATTASCLRRLKSQYSQNGLVVKVISSSPIIPNVDTSRIQGVDIPKPTERYVEPVTTQSYETAREIKQSDFVKSIPDVDFAALRASLDRNLSDTSFALRGFEDLYKQRPFMDTLLYK
tara:strand:+ start:263 stop:874 length:612 start_codon:yes stop_codon:yes gene_type:complete